MFGAEALLVSTTSILVVEDDLDLRSLYKMAFRHKPYGIHLAASGEEALDILARETDIQLILLDLSARNDGRGLFVESARSAAGPAGEVCSDVRLGTNWTAGL